MEYPSDYVNLEHALPEGLLDQTAPIRKVIGGPTGGRWQRWRTQQLEVCVALRVELHTGESVVRGSNCFVAHVLRAAVQCVRNALRELGLGVKVKKD
ncbi:hypothetical protein CDL15_Pgr016375 [Punica granatum]|uniref:Uncharacterized protein n=1 Tax=Punica granatum TaxID=22663 RepID=A0A218W5Y0_PUNGR|nr:hypothetical protein CDL15_Pgr016375 [Punica granatum]